MLAALSGCSDVKIDAIVKKVFEPRRTPQQYMLVAVSDPDPDLRRDAVTRIAKSDLHARDWAVKGFVAIALLENDSQTRCAAVRGLARGGDPRAVDTLVRILAWREYPAEEVRPPDDVCRWDAAAGLAELSKRGAVPDERRADVQRVLIDRLRSDSERHVRIGAARGLAYHPGVDAAEALIAGLRDDDFAVVRECEMSLVRLTGVTHDCDPYAWTTWLAQQREGPFASAGSVPESRRPPYTNLVEQAVYDGGQWLRFLFPGRKER